jgi:hypothetical protein
MNFTPSFSIASKTLSLASPFFAMAVTEIYWLSFYLKLLYAVSGARGACRAAIGALNEVATQLSEVSYST